MRTGSDRSRELELELVLLDGSGRRFGIAEGEELTVGAAAHCKVRLTAPDVSRRHALVARRQGRVVVMDLGSKNGTTIGGKRIVAEVELAPGETVKFSSVAAQVMPVGSTSPGLPVVFSDAEVQDVEIDHHSPTGEQEGLELQTGLAELLGRWSGPDGTATTGLVEWLVNIRRVAGAAVVERLRDEVVVLASAGKMIEVLVGLGEAELDLNPPTGSYGQTVRVDVGEHEVVSVSRGGLPWLLLLPGLRMLDNAEIELLLQLVAVARRIDGEADPGPVREGP